MNAMRTLLGTFSGFVTLCNTSHGVVFACQIREREREIRNKFAYTVIYIISNRDKNKFFVPKGIFMPCSQIINILNLMLMKIQT